MNNLTTDDLAAIIAAATERAGWHVEHGRRPIAKRADGQASTIVASEEKHMWTDEIGSVLQAEDGDFIANAPRTIIALVERIRELEAQRDALQEQARFADKRAAKYEAQMDYVESRNVLLGEWVDGNILPSKAAFYPVLAPAIGYYNQELKAWLVNLTMQDAAFWKDTPADYPEDSTLLPKP